VDPDSGSVSPNYTYTGTPAPRYVGRFVTNTTSAQPIFQFYAQNSTTPMTTPLSAADLLAGLLGEGDVVVRKQTTLPLRPITS